MKNHKGFKAISHVYQDEEAHIAFESELRQQLKRQAGAHTDHLAEVLKAQQKELEAIHKVALGERVLAERDNFKAEVAGYVARLKGIEAAVEGIKYRP